MNISGSPDSESVVKATDNVDRTARTRRLRRLHLIVAILTSAISIWLGRAAAFADMTVLTSNMRFCPSWAEAHERSLADLNHGRPPFPVKWRGCIVLKRGTCVDVVEQQDQSTEIVVGGKHWITDEMPDVVPGRACPTTGAAGKSAQ